MTTLHPTLYPPPGTIAALPRDHRGYPVPWFVAWDEDGIPRFQYQAAGKVEEACTHALCWTCGKPFIGSRVAYVIGPMCAVNRVSAEPASHVPCARWSAINCPFLAAPKKLRDSHTGARENVPGMMIERNPGVALVWHTRLPMRVFQPPGGGMLFDVGEPLKTEWYAERRDASRDEVLASIESGLPFLQAEAVAEGEDAVRALFAQRDAAMELVPA